MQFTLLSNDGRAPTDLLDKFQSSYNVNERGRDYIKLLADVAKIEYSCEIDQISLRQNDLLDRDIPTTRYMGARGVGFGNVASQFAEPLSDKIQLNSRVTRIGRYGEGEASAIVKYVRDGKAVRVRARTVLVTASLGVLKAGNIEFTPPLPDYKREVIDGMGFGVVNKCLMHWNHADDAAWPEDEYWFKLLRDDEDRWTYFFNPSSFKGAPALTAWIGGDDAVEMEQRTDDEVLDGLVLPHLRSMFPDVRRPDVFVITRWGSEPDVLGTYSYKRAHRNFKKDARDLGRRVGGLWFAGEATSPTWLGTTVGAWETGEEAARGMVRALRRQ